MEATSENIIKTIALGGELSNSTCNSLFCYDSTRKKTVRQRLARLMRDGLILRHPSNRERNIDVTYTLSAKARKEYGLEGEHLKYSSNPGTRLKRTLRTDFLSKVDLSGVRKTTIDEVFYNKGYGFCNTTEIEKEYCKDIFRNNQSIGIIFLPQQILVAYCIYSQMPFVLKNENNILQWLKREVEYGCLKSRYELRDIYYVFYYKGKETYLDWLMAQRTGGAKGIKDFVRGKLNRGHAVFLDGRSEDQSIMLIDMLTHSDYINDVKEWFLTPIDKSRKINGFLSDGAIGSRPVIINPFMDTAVTNSVFKEIVNYRKKHVEDPSIKPILLSFSSNAEILGEIARRRYPRSNPVEVMTIEYIRYKRYIGEATGSD